MRRTLLVVALALASLPALSGCASTSVFESRPAWHRWSEERGGVLEEAQFREERINRAWSVLAPVCQCEHTRIRILDDPRVQAFAWRDGSVFVTRGLLDTMDDVELLAALAHELGHLAGSHDGAAGRRREQLADAFGIDLLQRAGRPGSGMVRMLVKLHAHSAPIHQDGIHARIALLADRAEQRLGGVGGVAPLSPRPPGI